MSTNYNFSIVRDGLVMYLDAANSKSIVSGSNSWVDLSRNNNTGSLINGPTFSSLNGGSIAFDGTNDSVQLPTNFFNHNAGTPFSVSVWFRANSGSNGIIFGQTNAIGGGHVPAIYVGTGGKLHTSCFWGGSTTNQSTSSAAVNDGNYYNVTVTFASNSHKSYLNGELYATLSKGQSTYSTTYNYFVGSGTITGDWPSYGSNFLSGRIGHFMFYNRALSAFEVLQNYNASKKRFGL